MVERLKSLNGRPKICQQAAQALWGVVSLQLYLSVVKISRAYGMESH